MEAGLSSRHPWMGLVLKQLLHLIILIFTKHFFSQNTLFIEAKL